MISLSDFAVEIANARIRQKKGYKSSNPLNDNYELLGILGELVFAYQTSAIPNMRLIASGDPGEDINLNGKKIQVKTSESNKGLHLIEELKNDPLKYDYYVYVLVDFDTMTGEAYGWISSQDFLKKSEIINFGYGDKRALHRNHLNKFK